MAWTQKPWRMLASIGLIVAAFSASAADNALHFDGANDQVAMPVPAALAAANSFSTTVWIKPDSLPTAARVFFAQTDTSNFVTLLMSTSGAILGYVVNGGATVSTRSTDAVTAGAWNHVAMTWDASTSTVALYINGVLQPSMPGGASSTGTNGLMTIGSRTDGAQSFPGSMDRFDLFNRVLTASEVTTAKAGCQAPAGASNSYAFDQGNAGGNNAGQTSLPDGAGGNDGTLQNFALTGTASNWVASDVTSQCSYAVGGTVSGLTGTGLVLQINGGGNASISANGAFSLSAVPYGATYAVSVLSQPTSPAQSCTVTNGSGTVSGPVSNVAVVCTAVAVPPVAAAAAIPTLSEWGRYLLTALMAAFALFMHRRRSRANR